MLKRYITWDQFHSDCEKTAKKIVADDRKYDTIIAISRGGLVPARIICEYVNPKQFFVFGIKLYDGTDQGDSIKIYQDVPVDELYNNVLIIDDISDGGTTLQFAYRTIFAKAGGIKSYTACPYIKPSTKYIPTYYSHEFPDDEWVVFPFEKE